MRRRKSNFIERVIRMRVAPLLNFYAIRINDDMILFITVKSPCCSCTHVLFCLTKHSEAYEDAQCISNHKTNLIRFFPRAHVDGFIRDNTLFHNPRKLYVSEIQDVVIQHVVFLVADFTGERSYDSYDCKGLILKRHLVIFLSEESPRGFSSQ